MTKQPFRWPRISLRIHLTGAIDDTRPNSAKFARLRERKFIDNNGRVNIMAASAKAKKRLSNLPELSSAEIRKYSDVELKQRISAQGIIPSTCATLL